MKKLIYILIGLTVLNTSLPAQTISRVIADTYMTEYVWAIGYGKNLEEADNDAMKTLAQNAVDITVLGSDEVKDINNHSQRTFSEKTSTISNMYLDNVVREVLPDERGMKRVLRYISREDWESRHDALKNKIEEYIESGKYASLVEDRIRYYTWAHILLQTYPNTATPIKVESSHARQWLHEQVRDILDDIDISVIAIEQDKNNRNYPYKLYLDFIYEGEPISYLRFGYFDGSGYVESESVKDGRGIIQIKHLEPEIAIDIDCLSKELARQIEPSVSNLLEGGHYETSFAEGHKTVATQSKPKKKVDTTSPKIESKVNEMLVKNEAEYVEIQERVTTTRPFESIIDDIAESISKPSSKDVRHHFTDGAWKQYLSIVANGAPMLARTPEYKFIQHDTLTICQSLPVKLSFVGNHSFIEDVVFRINNRTMKVESVAYKLSAKTEQTIMAMAWDDKARLTLISFLEDYRSAYCLKNLDYINKVFADDAYIIVGRVLKASTKKFSDSPQSINATTTVYDKKSKQQYVSDLRKSFASKEFINLRFEECNVAKGYDAKEGIYAVQVNQLYYSDNYADNGILTLAIDMREETDPLVRVRIWQQLRDVTYTAEDMIERTVSVDTGL